MFLRFLIAEGQCAVGLDAAIPTLAHWRLASLPRYLPPEEVERLIASCDRASAVGRRDRAILLLLARLGLRAGDIVHLRLSDIDWKGASIQVSGKGRRSHPIAADPRSGSGDRGLPEKRSAADQRRYAVCPLPCAVLRLRLSWCCLDDRRQGIAPRGRGAPQSRCRAFAAAFAWRRPCCVKAHRSRTSPPSCVTAPLRRRRSTPKWISRLCGKLHNPGRRRSHVDPSCRDLSGRSSGSWFRVEVPRFSVEKLRCVLRGEKAALRFYRYRHRMGGIGTIGSATCPSARDGHSIRPLSPRRGRTP